MRTRLIIVCLFLLPAMTVSAFAAEKDEAKPEPSRGSQQSYAHKGFYLGAGGTWAFQLFQNQIEDLVNTDIKLGQTFGANANMGYRVASWLSTGVGYEFLNGFNAEVNGKDALHFKGNAVTADFKIHFIPVGPIQPNFLIGVGGMKYIINDELGLGLKGGQWAFAGRLGGGVDFYFTRHCLMNVEGSAVLTTNDITNPTSARSVTGLYYFSTQLGFQYRW